MNSLTFLEEASDLEITLGGLHTDIYRIVS